jgi:ABC-2 type transport system permease protein
MNSQASAESADRSRSGRPPSWRRPAVGFVGYVRFEILRTLWSRQYQLLAALLPVALYLLDTQPGLGRQPTMLIDGGSWSANALDRLATLGALGAGLTAAGSRLAADRADGWVRTLRLIPLSSAQMLAGRVVAGVASAGLAVLLVTVAGGLIRGVAMPLAGWFLLIVSVSVGALPFALLGVLVGMSMGRGIAVGAVLVLYLGLAFVGGLLEPIASLSALIATIGSAMPSFLVRDLAWRAALGQGPSAQDATLLAAESFGLASLVFWNRRSA